MKAKYIYDSSGNFSWLTIIVLTIMIFLCLLVSGCVTQKKCNSKFPPSVDSIYIEKLLKEKVYLPGDTIKLTTPANCPDQDLVLMENGKLKQTISILNGKLHSNTVIKPDTVITYYTNTVTKIVEKPVPVKFVPKFHKFCVKGFFALSGLIVLYILWRIYKPKLKV